MTATGRSFAGWYGSQTGRTPRSRNARVKYGYDRSYPRAVVGRGKWLTLIELFASHQAAGRSPDAV